MVSERFELWLLGLMSTSTIMCDSLTDSRDYGKYSTCMSSLVNGFYKRGLLISTLVIKLFIHTVLQHFPIHNSEFGSIHNSEVFANVTGAWAKFAISDNKLT